MVVQITRSYALGRRPRQPLTPSSPAAYAGLSDLAVSRTGEPVKSYSGARPQLATPARPAGTYIGCAACGRLLRIFWPTRSIVCSCGARVIPPNKVAQ